MWVRRCADSQAQCQNPGHAEAKERAGDDELVSFSSVGLEDEHVADRGADVEEQEDCADWYVCADCCMAA